MVGTCRPRERAGTCLPVRIRLVPDSLAARRVRWSGAALISSLIVILVLSSAVGVLSNRTNLSSTMPNGVPSAARDTALHGVTRQIHSNTNPTYRTGPRWIPRSTSYTLDPFNGSLIQGVTDPPSPAYPEGMMDIPSLGEYVVGDAAGNAAYIVNASTGSEIRSINFGGPSLQFAGSDPIGFAFDPSRGILFSALLGDGSIAFVDLASGEVVGNVSLPGHPYGLVYDGGNDRLYATNGSGIFEFNGTTGSVIAFLPIHWGVTPIIIDPLTNSLLTADSGNNSIYTVNITQFRLVGQFPTGTNGAGYNPQALLYDPGSRQVYAADYGNGSVSVIDARTYQLNSTTPQIDVGGYPNSLALNPFRHEIYVSSCQPFGSRVCALSDTNGTLANLTFPNSVPGWVAYDPSTQHLLIYNNNDSLHLVNGTNDRGLGYVSMVTSYLGGTFDPMNGFDYIATPALGGVCSIPGRVTVVNPAPNPKFVDTLPAGDGPSQVAYDSADERVFVTNYCSNSVTVINATSDSVVQSNLPVGSEPYGIAYDSLNDTIWIANYNSQNLTVLNGSSLATVHTINLPLGFPYDLALDPITHSAFVSDLSGNAVTVVNATTYSISGSSVPVGTSPQGLVYDPQNGDVYVANGGSNNVTVINATNRSVVGSIATAGGTTALTMDPADHLVIATDAGGSRIVVIDTLSGLAEIPSLPASGQPQGLVYVPTDDQIDVFNFGASAIDILANTPDPTNFTASPARAEVGNSLALSATTSNGTPPYTFSYSGLPPGCVSANSPVLVCTPASPGEFAVTLTVTDSAGYFGSATVNVSVWARLGSGTISTTSPAIDLGMTSIFALSGYGGVPPLTYSFAGLPSGCVSSNVAALACTPTLTGDFVVVGTVTDELGVTMVAATDLVVNPLPRIEAFVVSSSSVPVNTSVVFLASVSGGTGAVTYTFVGLPPGCASSDAAILACAPTAPGNYTVILTATDSLGRGMNASLLLRVTSPPVVTPLPQISAFFADPATLIIGTNVTFYVVHSGGTPPYSLSWSGLPAGCLGNPQTGFTLTCRPTQVGNFSIGLNLTDDLGRSTEGRTSLTVLAAGSSITIPPSNLGISEVTLAFVVLGTAAVGAFVGSAVSVLLYRRTGKPPDGSAPDS